VHVLIYWLARTALMFCVFVVLWGFGWRPWLAVVGAAVIAWLISYSMFGSMHDLAAKQMESWVSRRFVGVAGDEVAEDSETEVAEAEVAEAEVAKPEVRTKPAAVAKSTPKPTAKSRAKAVAKAGSASTPRRAR
jgi:hypothetical protein